MQTLYFVRHGQTELNAKDHVQGGDIDSPLLEKSREDAIKTGLYLRNEPIDRLISSPQLRAKNTALLINSQFQTELPFEIEPLLKEFSYGEWEGLHIPTVAKQWPETFYHLRNQPHLYDPRSFGGESYPDLIKRGTKAVTDYADRYSDANLLFVGHSITLTATILSLVGYDLKDIRSQTPMANTSVSRLKRQGDRFILESWNETAHLDE